MASYNCSDSQNQAYGAGNYSSCDGTTTSTGNIGAPNTGFMQFASDGSLMIILPLIAAVILTAVAMIVGRKSKKAKADQ